MNVSRAALAFLALVILASSGVGAAGLKLDYEVDEQILVEGCGGFDGSCREYFFKGSLELTLDADNRTAALSVANLGITEQADGAPVRLDLPRSLSGNFEGRTIRFTTPPDSRQTLDWTMTLTEKGLVLQGSYNEGCCDRLRFTFRNVSFSESKRRPSTVLRLNEGRFAVEAVWKDFAGNVGQGKAVALNASSGHFWFFDPDNTEIVVKVLDACQSFGHFWVFAAGMTNVEVELVVTDLATGLERRYANAMGKAFEPVLDVDAFSTCDAE